jgi:hypothetical protein
MRVFLPDCEVGHAADAFAKPRAAWDPSGRYVLSNSQAEGTNQVLVWCLAQQRVVHKLGGPGCRARAETPRSFYC